MLRRALTLIIGAVVLFTPGCKHENTNTEDGNDSELMQDIEQITISREAGDCIERFKCMSVRINYPKLNTGNDGFKETVNTIIFGLIDDHLVTETDVADDNIENYIEKKLDQLAPRFESAEEDNIRDNLILEIDIEPVFVNNQLFCLRSSYISDTGGAHGNQAISYFIIEHESGKLLELEDVVDKTSVLREMALGQIKAKNKVSADKDISEIGYFDSDNEFQLNNNIGISSDSISITYVPYEISPYSMGYTKLAFSREELADILQPDFVEKWQAE